VLAVSSAAGLGLEELKERLWRFVEEAKAQESVSPDGTSDDLSQVPGYWDFMDDE